MQSYQEVVYPNQPIGFSYLYKNFYMAVITELLNKMPELSYSELETINETVKKIMTEKRRDEIKRLADESLRLYREGKLQGFAEPQKMVEWLMEEDETN